MWAGLIPSTPGRPRQGVRPIPRHALKVAAATDRLSDWRDPRGRSRSRGREEGDNHPGSGRELKTPLPAPVQTWSRHRLAVIQVQGDQHHVQLSGLHSGLRPLINVPAPSARSAR